MSRLRGLRIGALALLAGCYTYAPVEVGEVPPGSPVRARLSRAESERLTEALGREVRVLQGELVREEPGGVVLTVAATGQSPDSPLRLKQQVVVPRPELIEVEVRRLDRWKTGGIVAAGALVAGWLVTEQIRSSQRGRGGDGGKGGVDAVAIPLVRLIP